jgi:hypothetical protein
VDPRIIDRYIQGETIDVSASGSESGLLALLLGASN